MRFASTKATGGTQFAFAGGVFSLPTPASAFNASHRVERLRFGPTLPDQPVVSNPLTGNAKYTENGEVSVVAAATSALESCAC